MANFKNLLTPARRKALYLALIPVFGILIAHGLITAEDAGHVIESLGYLLGIAAVGVARANVNNEVSDVEVAETE